MSNTPNKCVKCCKNVSTKDGQFKCKKCLKVYHKTCIKVSRGVCENCVLDTPTISPAPKVFLDLDPKNVTVESLLHALNEKMEVVFKIKEDTGFYAEKYDEMLLKQNEILAAMKKQQNIIDDITNRCKHFEKLTQALEQRVQAIEQKDKSKNIELVGVILKENENIKETVGKVAMQLGVDIKDVEKAWRVGRAVPGRRPPPIIVRLCHESARDLWMSKRGLLRSNKVLFPGEPEDTPIYVNEDLTKYNRELLWNAKQSLRGIFKYVWVKKGRILCKKTDDSRTLNITTRADLEAVAKS